MNVLFPDPSLVWMLRRVVGIGLRYHLYMNDVSPALSDTLTRYVPATWSGYSSILVPASAWIINHTAAHVGELEALPISFSNTSPATVKVYGYFVTDDSGTQLVCSSRLDQSPVAIVRGTSLSVTPILGSYSGLAL